MQVEFSKHSLDQLKVRSRITKVMILLAVRSPDEVVRTYRGRKLYRKRYSKEMLEIVAVKEDNKLIIITQYFLELT